LTEKESLEVWRREKEEREKEETLIKEMEAQEKIRSAHEEWKKLKATGTLERRHKKVNFIS
jgi:hypothetical protein